MNRSVERQQDNSPVLREDEKVLHVERNVEAVLDSTSEGKGELYVTTRRVVWLQATATGRGEGADGSSRDLSLDFPCINMHATCRDPESYPKPCIYCQLETADDSLSEARFIPDNVDALTEMYSAFSSAAEMNPDPVEDDEGEAQGEAGDFFFDMEEVKAGAMMDSVTREMGEASMNGIATEQGENGQLNGTHDEEEDANMS